MPTNPILDLAHSSPNCRGDHAKLGCNCRAKHLIDFMRCPYLTRKAGRADPRSDSPRLAGWVVPAHCRILEANRL